MLPPSRDRQARADPADQRAGEGGADDQHGGHRQQVHPGRDRAEGPIRGHALNHVRSAIRVISGSILYPETHRTRSTEDDVIELAAIEDNQLLIDGLRAWAGTLPDI